MNNLDSLLKSLLTEEGKRRAIVKAVALGKSDKPEYIEMTVQFCREKKLYELAGDILRRSNDPRANGLYTIAMMEYEQHGEFNWAARLAEKLGDTERAEAYRTLAKELNIYSPVDSV